MTFFKAAAASTQLLSKISTIQSEPLSVSRRVLDQAPALNRAVFDVREPDQKEFLFLGMRKAEMRTSGVPKYRILEDPLD